MRLFAHCARIALIALSSCTLGTAAMARADDASQAGIIPQGWVWQGVWQDGRWSGQWIPGPGLAPDASHPGGYPPPPPGPQYLPVTPPAPGTAPMMVPTVPYAAPGYPVVGYMVAPAMPQAAQAPCVETRTVTTEYLPAWRPRVRRARRHSIN